MLGPVAVCYDGHIAQNREMGYIPTIDNDSVAALPAARFEGRIVIVDKEEQIEAACNDLRSASIIGFDTETRPSFRAGVSYKVSLLQLSTAETCYLFRLSHIRLDNRILKILGSRQILKVAMLRATYVRYTPYVSSAPTALWTCSTRHRAGVSRRRAYVSSRR